MNSDECIFGCQLRDDATLASMESQHAGMAGHIEVAFAREGTKYIIPAGVDK